MWQKLWSRINLSKRVPGEKIMGQNLQAEFLVVALLKSMNIVVQIFCCH